MNELVREWIEKAEADSRTTERESRVTDGRRSTVNATYHGVEQRNHGLCAAKTLYLG